jgi:hypothetical protein
MRTLTGTSRSVEDPYRVLDDVEKARLLYMYSVVDHSTDGIFDAARASSTSTFIKLQVVYSTFESDRQWGGMGPVKLTQHALSTPTPRITVAEFAYALLKRWVPQRRGRDILG